MRLFLLPISTRRTLLYCQKLQSLPTEKQTYVDKTTIWAAKLWAGWERSDSGWKKKVVSYGNYALRRVPYEEWGLKSVPPLSTKRREEDILGKDKNQLIFPETVIPATKAMSVLRTLGTERESIHKSRLIWCCVGMPISLPFALVPVIPNLPFFYLAYRAWSHWRALAGGKHIQFICSKNLLSISPSPVLDSIYPALLPRPSLPKEPTIDSKKANPSSATDTGIPKEEIMLLTQKKGRQLVKALDVPELEVELERAIWQVEMAIQKEKEKVSETPNAASPQSSSAENNEK
ncbi:mitochondrial K+-H+ exchange-related-domain-containing protein [Whalleya microplaca]|nr:mitochondrial K+-H+ exchange-related-domain-containing protein [Whalleya microplaca]